MLQQDSIVNGLVPMPYSVLFVWGKWLPYHYARAQASAKFFKEEGLRLIGVQYSDVSRDYQLNSDNSDIQFEFLNPKLGDHETDFRPLRILKCWPRLLIKHKVKVVFIPSYWDWSVTLAAVSRLFGCRVVMMNESHAGTEKAVGWKRFIKRQIVKRFDAALVGGKPHQRHFGSLGIPLERIFTGYDAIDNAYYSDIANMVRDAEFAVQRFQSGEIKSSNAQDGCVDASYAASFQGYRAAYELPDQYFLSLGRMVKKKNLSTLLEAYALFVRTFSAQYGLECHQRRLQALPLGHTLPSLVFVGSGECEQELRDYAVQLGLRVVDRSYVFPNHQLSMGHTLGAGIATDLSEFSPDSGPIPPINDTRSAYPKATNTDEFPKILNSDSSSNAATSSTGSMGFTSESYDATKSNPNCEDHATENGVVYFYGLRQIQENPIFYALADVFVLPSLKEEWGLVVNEAMASGLPVVVSQTAGCAEDLLPKTWPKLASSADRESFFHNITPQLSFPSTIDQECSFFLDSLKQLPSTKLERRLNGFVFDPTSSVALSQALTSCLVLRGINTKDSNALLKMGGLSRMIVDSYGCENFGYKALCAVKAACLS
jgi:glycosyltransferase involved in cell wall biosynthesis